MSLSAFLELSETLSHTLAWTESTYRSRHKFQQHCVHYTIFIRIHDPQEDELADEEYDNQGSYTGDGFVRQVSNVEDNNSNGAVTRQRDQIAQSMWQSYQAILRAREASDDVDEFCTMRM